MTESGMVERILPRVRRMERRNNRTHMPRVLLRYGAVAGLIAAAAEFLMLYAAAPTLGALFVLQATAFWFACGVVAVTCEWGLPAVAQALCVTLVLFFPWLVNGVLIPREWGHFAPMLVQAVVFGLLFGAARRRALRQARMAGVRGPSLRG